LGDKPGIYHYGEFDSGLLNIDTQKVFDPSHFWLSENHHFYQDEYFTMSECCAGEFGGTVFIESKFSDSNEYAIQSVCPLQILRKGIKSYYLINDLRHMSGSSSIVKIDSVKNIMRVDQGVERYCNYYSEFFERNMNGYNPLMYDSLNNLILGDGNEYIFDSIRIQILNGFVLTNNDLAVLYMSEGKMKYGIIKDGEIKNVKVKYEIENVDWTYAKSIDFTNSKGIFTQDIKWDTISRKEITLSNSIILIDKEDPDKFRAYTFRRSMKNSPNNAPPSTGLRPGCVGATVRLSKKSCKASKTVVS